MARRGSTRRQNSSAAAMSVPRRAMRLRGWSSAVNRARARLPSAFIVGRGRAAASSRPRASTSRTTRSACFWPLRGGMYSSTSRWNSSSPTLSSLWMAENASRADSSTAASRLERSAEPKSSEALTSTSSMTVSWRSST